MLKNEKYSFDLSHLMAYYCYSQGMLWLFYVYTFVTGNVLTSRTSRHTFHTGPYPDFQKLTVWIEGKEIEHFLGYRMDIFIIEDGEVASYLQDAYMNNQLPILPPEVTKVEISWMAKDETFYYKFPDLRSLDRDVMYDPLMSIATQGSVPKEKTTFHITLSCTGEKTGIASMYLSLGIVNSKWRHIQGSPVKLHIRKRCIAFAESKTECEGDCQNGGTCNSGKCLCKKGYFGSFCQYVACYPACENNGTCIKPGKCNCSKGYSGPRCKTIRCKHKCSGRGSCIAPNTCSCPSHFYGRNCQYRTGSCPTLCHNGGTCTEQDSCACPKGYTGHDCQKPVCKKSCGIHGYCADVNTCECYKGWRGRFCHKHVHRISNLNPENRRKHGRSRKQRHTKKISSKNKKNGNKKKGKKKKLRS